MKLNKDVFKRLLKENNMSIVSFSKEVGISRDSVNNWLYRNNNIPHWKCEIIEEFFLEKGINTENLFKKE